MGFVNNSHGIGGHSSRQAFRPMADINVTPMVDVMLVLLVIFMVTAPLLTVGVEVNLPKSNAPNLAADDKPLSLTIDAVGDIWIQEEKISTESLVPKLRAILGANPEAKIYVRGDKGIAYGRVMEIMGIINAAGYKKVALVAKSPDQ